MTSALERENAELRKRVADAERRAAQITLGWRTGPAVSSDGQPATERNDLAAAQARVDSVQREFGMRASAPVPGESPAAYRARVLAPLQKHSDQFRNARLDGISGSALDVVEERILADAAAAAQRPESHPPGTLVEVKSFENGREVTRYNGDPMAWLAPFMTSGAFGSFIRDPRGN